MKNLSHKLSLFSILAFVAFEPQNLQATSSSSSDEELQDFQKPQKSLTLGSLDFLKDTLQKIKNYQYLSDSAFQYIADISFEEIKQLTSTMTPDHDMFDAWIRLILQTFPKHPDFEDVLKVAKLKSESEAATPMARGNLGTMYRSGYSVGRDLAKAIEYYKKAADQGYAQAQYELGVLSQHGYVIDKDLIKAFEYYKKAANQNHPCAQYYLGDMYRNGEGVDIDLAQSLKWYLESSKNKCKIHDLKFDLKSLITFVPSAITPTDEVNLTKNQKTLKNDIEDLLYLHGLEKGINTSYESKKGTNELIFEEGGFAIPSLVEKYQKIVDFEEILLKFILASDQPGFMVTCLQPKDIDAFKSSHCPDIKYYELQGQSFLTFGQDNIEAADKLKIIFDQSQPVYKAISNILGVLTEIHQSFQTGIQLNDLAKDLKTQYAARLKLGSKNQPLDPMRTLARHKALVEKVEQGIEVLTQLQAIPQQLTDSLIEGAPIRNKLFLQNNDYIEPIFKD